MLDDGSQNRDPFSPLDLVDPNAAFGAIERTPNRLRFLARASHGGGDTCQARQTGAIFLATMVSAILRHVTREQSHVEERAVIVAALRRQIDRAIAERRFHFANHFCNRVLAEDPRNLEMWLLRGYLAWHHLNDPRRAVESFRQVLILGGFESSNAYVAQARVSLAQLLERLS